MILEAPEKREIRKHGDVCKSKTDETAGGLPPLGESGGLPPPLVRLFRKGGGLPIKSVTPGTAGTAATHIDAVSKREHKRRKKTYPKSCFNSRIIDKLVGLLVLLISDI